MTWISLGTNVAHTWTEDNGNNGWERAGKTVVQSGGAAAGFILGNATTGKAVADAMISSNKQQKIATLPVAFAADYYAGVAINEVQDWILDKLGIE